MPTEEKQNTPYTMKEYYERVQKPYIDKMPNTINNSLRVGPSVIVARLTGMFISQFVNQVHQKAMVNRFDTVGSQVDALIFKHSFTGEDGYLSNKTAQFNALIGKRETQPDDPGRLIDIVQPLKLVNPFTYLHATVEMFRLGSCMLIDTVFLSKSVSEQQKISNRSGAVGKLARASSRTVDLINMPKNDVTSIDPTVSRPAIILKSAVVYLLTPISMVTQALGHIEQLPVIANYFGTEALDAKSKNHLFHVFQTQRENEAQIKIESKNQPKQEINNRPASTTSISLGLSKQGEPDQNNKNGLLNKAKWTLQSLVSYLKSSDRAPARFARFVVDKLSSQSKDQYQKVESKEPKIDAKQDDSIKMKR